MLNPAPLRILRGEEWGARLQRVLETSNLTPDQWMVENTRELKRDDGSRVGLFELEGQLCYLKLFAMKSQLQALGYRAGRGRALQSFDMAHALADSDIPVPKPRCCLKAGNCILLLTEGKADARDLNDLWLSGMTEVEQGRWITAAGALLGQLHAAGFAHGDTKWTNLLCAGDRLYLVDLEGVRQLPQGHALMSRDLARFTLNAEDRELEARLYNVFLETYGAATGLSPASVIAGLKPSLGKLRARHRKQYGERGRRLV